jgi:DNA-binding LytR/AlgR family response regulator
MADVMNGQELPVNVPRNRTGEQPGPGTGGSAWLFADRRPVLVVLLLWAVQFAAFSIDRLVRYPGLEGGDTLAARLIVTAAGAILSLIILKALQQSARRSFLARSVFAFLLALAAACAHALVNIVAFRLVLGPASPEPLVQEMALTLPPLIFFFSWVHLAIAVVLLSLTYGHEVVEKERKFAEVSGQLATLRMVRPDVDDQPHIWVRANGRKVRVDVAAIDWIAAEGEYVRLHIGERSLLERRSMGELETQLEPLGLVRVHRSTIVNSKRIDSLGRTRSGALFVKLDTGLELRVGKSFQPKVRMLARPVIRPRGDTAS